MNLLKPCTRMIVTANHGPSQFRWKVPEHFDDEVAIDVVESWWGGVVDRSGLRWDRSESMKLHGTGI